MLGESQRDLTAEQAAERLRALSEVHIIKKELNNIASLLFKAKRGADRVQHLI